MEITTKTINLTGLRSKARYSCSLTAENQYGEGPAATTTFTMR